MIRIVSNIILSLLVLISSCGIIVNLHYCGSQLKNVALFVNAENCHYQKSKSCCEGENVQICHAAEKDGNCCNSEAVYFHSEQELIKTEINSGNFVPLSFSFIEAFLFCNYSFSPEWLSIKFLMHWYLLFQRNLG